jgi:hypothetical protein
MNVYWSLKSIPELADLPPRERRRLWRACWGKVACHWQVLFVGFGLVPATSAAGLYLAGYLALAIGLGWPLAFLVVLGILCPAAGFIGTQLCVPVARPYLRVARAATQEGRES